MGTLPAAIERACEAKVAEFDPERDFVVLETVAGRWLVETDLAGCGGAECRKTLEGLMSRWIMRLEWMCFSALDNCPAHLVMRSSLNVCPDPAQPRGGEDNASP